MLKRRDPTMKRSTLEEKGSEDKLDKLYNNLEKEWDYMKNSKPRALRRCSTDSSIMVKTLPLLDGSPTTLMSSLQHPLEEVEWKVRTNDLAVMEILRERRAAIESGKLKGRRLFYDDAEMWNGGNGLNQECEVRSMYSYDSDEEEGVGESDMELPVCYQGGSYSSSSSTSQLCETVENEMKEANDAEEVAAEAECKSVASRGRWRVGLSWLALPLIVCSVVITSVRCFGGNRDEVLLVPT